MCGRNLINWAITMPPRVSWSQELALRLRSNAGPLMWGTDVLIIWKDLVQDPPATSPPFPQHPAYFFMFLLLLRSLVETTDCICCPCILLVLASACLLWTDSISYHTWHLLKSPVTVLFPICLIARPQAPTPLPINGSILSSLGFGTHHTLPVASPPPSLLVFLGDFCVNHIFFYFVLVLWHLVPCWLLKDSGLVNF